jgi:type I restriction enzyme, S subunit
MTPEELKNSILQMAIQGKLVEQRPEEGTAEELYRQIQIEKQKLIKAGTIKKEKPLPDITEDEKPFEIPESWKWVKFEQTINLVSGQDLLPSQYNDTGSGIPYITGASNIGESGILINRWTLSAKAIAKKGDLLITCKGTVGKTAILQEYRVHIARQVMAITPILVNTKFIEHFLQYQIEYLKSQAKSMIPGIERKTVLCLLLPLPPLAEQKRIVDRIEELLPHIDRYGEIWRKLEDLNKRFPDDMKKSILQMAIQGKLVEQRPEEGTAEELYRQIQIEKQKLIKEGTIKKEKPLPDITEDEKPFDIPESWKWVRLNSLAMSIKAGGDKPKDFSVGKTGKNTVPVIANGIQNNGIIGYTQVGTFDEPCITVSGRGTIGFSCIRTEPFYPIVRLLVLIISKEVCIKYIKIVLTALLERGVGTSIQQLTVPMLEPKLIPIPPLSEQKRIVAKLEKIFPLCDEIEEVLPQ